MVSLEKKLADTLFRRFCDALVHPENRLKTKKSRTPRDENAPVISFNPHHVVPEMETEELSSNDNIHYQVPLFDDANHDNEFEDPFDHLNDTNGFTLPSDSELAEFAADHELRCRLNHLVKAEDENPEVVWDAYENIPTEIDHIVHDTREKRSKMLKLDYDGIIAGWDDDRSPWTTGDRPEFDLNHVWPECMVGCENMLYCHSGDMGMKTIWLDTGREARVSRYREKRLTRLFSRKIRYEVRKMNADKRPRMKGRFVKRSSFAT